MSEEFDPEVFRKNFQLFRENLREAFRFRRREPLLGCLRRSIRRSADEIVYDETRIVIDEATGKKYKLYLDNGRVVYSEEIMPQPRETVREGVEAEVQQTELMPARPAGQADIWQRLREWRESRPSILRSIAKVFEESSKQVEIETEKKRLELQRLQKLLQQQEAAKKDNQEELERRFRVGKF